MKISDVWNIKLLILLTLRSHGIKAQCSLYIAPSSTTEENEQIALSMYTGVDLNPGDIIGRPEIAVPVIDMDLHNNLKEGLVDENYFYDLAEFMWTPESLHGQFDSFSYKTKTYEENSEASQGGTGWRAAIPGIGALGRMHRTAYYNADFNHFSTLFRTPIRISDTSNAPPTRGANSHYYNITLEATKFIPAGMEILMDSLGKEEETILLSNDFIDADEILTKIDTFFDKHGASMSEKKKLEVYNYLIRDVVRNVGTKSVMEDPERKNDEEAKDAITELFPKHPNAIKKILLSGGTFLQEYPETQKSIQWLEENGQCCDGLYPGPSTVLNAEKGAFSSRDVKQGELIAPSPLLKIDDENILSMYSKLFKGENDDGDFDYVIRDPEGEGVIGTQLLYNYCFGHPQSTILFYPYGMTVNFINHKPTGKGANAKVVWTKAKYHDPDLFLLTAEDLKQDRAMVPLGFDIIATRDISAHEEVFIDYGPEFEFALQRHSREWERRRSWPKQALEMNAEIANEKKHFIPIGDRPSDFPENIFTACHAYGIPLDESDKDIPRKIDDVKVYKFDTIRTSFNGHDMNLCDILNLKESESGEYFYVIQLFTNDEEDEESIIIVDVPEKYIMYVDMPYSSWTQAEGVFRHYIGIPDEIFPETWKNLK